MLKTATRVPLLVGHTTGLHLPAPSYILFERVREPRNVMSPLSFLSMYIVGEASKIHELRRKAIFLAAS